MKIRLLFCGQLLAAARVAVPEFNFANEVRMAVFRERDEEPPLSGAISPLTTPPSSPTLQPCADISSVSSTFVLADSPICAEYHLSGNSKKRHSKAQSKANKRKKRQQQNADPTRYEVPASVLRNHIQPAVGVTVEGSVEDQPVSAGAYVGWRREEMKTKTWKLSQMVGPKSVWKFRLLKWNGKETIPLIEDEDCISAVCLGQPEDIEGKPTWKSSHLAAADAIEQERRKCSFTSAQKHHWRGEFPALACGVSHGGGQHEPCNLCHNKANAAALNRLCQNEHIVRLAWHASAGFAAWAPDLYVHYSDYRTRLAAGMAGLLFGIAGCIWAVVTFNFGPRTVSFEHTDHGNLPYGWCAVTALGRYNYKSGGHLILWDLQLVIQFPPGSTIMLPSGVYRHSNTTISRGECRYSIAHYTPGGLFRWVDNGFQTDEQYRAKHPKRVVKAQREVRWKKGLALFSTLQRLNATVGEEASE